MFLFISKPDFACNPYALWKYITENTQHKTAWLVTSREHLDILRRRGIRCELYDTVKGNELAATATYIVSNVYVFGALPKCEGQVLINLWHGSGIKAHDFYDPNLHPQQVDKVLEFSSKTDLMCVHSLDDRFRLSAMLHYDLRKSIVTGQARLDCVKTSGGREKLKKIYGDVIDKFQHLIFFAPSFRANSSGHSGRFFSDNVFRLMDFDDGSLNDFLDQYNAALIYKLHPVEQTALRGVKFSSSSRCFELTDEMLFYADVRYDEILNSFDVMVSDYSSIAYDFLLLDRPIVYLVPDYDEYKSMKGFVFNNIDYYMPGAKACSFAELLAALKEALSNPKLYQQARKNVLAQRFDFDDDHAAERCYQAIINYVVPVNKDNKKQRPTPRLLPSNAQLLKRHIPSNIIVVDSTSSESLQSYWSKDKVILYITGEKTIDAYRSVSQRASTDIADISLYHRIKNLPNTKIAFVAGGVEYELFAKGEILEKKDKITIGFAGTIDCRIYFAMVQYLCEAFQDYDFVFAGDIFGDPPAWLNGYPNLRYLGVVAYEKLPDVIATFDVAILPFYGKYQEQIPTELFQYLACGKPVVASHMLNLPECEAIYTSRSVADAVEQVKMALLHCKDKAIINSAQKTAKMFDWKQIANTLIETVM